MMGRRVDVVIAGIEEGIWNSIKHPRARGGEFGRKFTDDVLGSSKKNPGEKMGTREREIAKKAEKNARAVRVAQAKPVPLGAGEFDDPASRRGASDAMRILAKKSVAGDATATAALKRVASTAPKGTGAAALDDLVKEYERRHRA